MDWLIYNNKMVKVFFKDSRQPLEGMAYFEDAEDNETDTDFLAISPKGRPSNFAISVYPDEVSDIIFI